MNEKNPNNWGHLDSNVHRDHLSNTATAAAVTQLPHLPPVTTDHTEPHQHVVSHVVRSTTDLHKTKEVYVNRSPRSLDEHISVTNINATGIRHSARNLPNLTPAHPPHPQQQQQQYSPTPAGDRDRLHQHVAEAKHHAEEHRHAKELHPLSPAHRHIVPEHADFFIQNAHSLDEHGHSSRTSLQQQHNQHHNDHHNRALTAVADAKHREELARTKKIPVQDPYHQERPLPKDADFFIKNAHAHHQHALDVHLPPVQQHHSYANDHHDAKSAVGSQFHHHSLPQGTEWFIENARSHSHGHTTTSTHQHSNSYHTGHAHFDAKELNPVQRPHTAHAVGSLFEAADSKPMETTADTIFHTFTGVSPASLLHIEIEKPVSIAAHDLGEQIPMHHAEHLGEPVAPTHLGHSAYFDQDELVILEDQIADVAIADDVIPISDPVVTVRRGSGQYNQDNVVDDNSLHNSHRAAALSSDSSVAHSNLMRGILDDDELVVLQEQIIDISDDFCEGEQGSTHASSHTGHDQDSVVTINKN